MRLIEQVRTHFDGLTRARIEVPEWAGDDGKPAVIYARPMTMAEKQKIANAGANDGHIASLVTTLILKAEDEAGNKVFTLDDKHTLMNRADTEVLARIILQMRDTPSVEAQEKKS